MPTNRGKNHDEHASGTMPRFAKTKPNFAFVLAKRISIGNVIVAPTPTAAPLMAAMTGFFNSKMRSETSPPPSRTTPPLSVMSLPPFSNVLPPLDKSAPAQKARPLPVMTRARMSSFPSTSSNATLRSRTIWLVKALSASGRCNVMVAIPSETSNKISVKVIPLFT